MAGYAAPMVDVAKGLAGQPTDAPHLADGVAAMANLERMITGIERIEGN